MADIRKVLPKPYFVAFSNPYRAAVGMSKERKYFFLSHFKPHLL